MPSAAALGKKAREPGLLIKMVSLRGLLSAASNFFFFGPPREFKAAGSGNASIFRDLGDMRESKLCSVNVSVMQQHRGTSGGGPC